MRYIHFSLIFVIILLVGCSKSALDNPTGFSIYGLDEGVTVPEFNLRTIDGRNINL